MRPNFLIIGAMKAGTTSLFAYLKTHPEIYMPTNKEPNFFSDENVRTKGIKWYESLFNAGKDCKAIGEGSVNYSKYPHYKKVPERIHSFFPDMKLIYVLRSPIERIYSHYLHNIYAGIEEESLEKALIDRPLYIQTSLYHSQIEQYLKYFHKDNILIFLLDDMKSDSLKVVQTVFDFLDVFSSYVPPNIQEIKHQTKLKKGKDNTFMQILRKMPFYHHLADFVPENIKATSSIILKSKLSEPNPLTDEVFNWLINQIKTDVDKLSAFLERDLSCWDLNER